MNNKLYRAFLWSDIKRKKYINISLIVTVIAISTLFITTANIGYSVYKSYQEYIFEIVQTKAHAVYSNTYFENVEAILSDNEVVDGYYSTRIGSLEYDGNIDISYFSEESIKDHKVELIEGTLPQSKNEIVTSLEVLEKLEYEPILGSIIKITYLVGGIKFENEFVLSGYYETTEQFRGLEQVIVNEEFIAKHKDMMLASKIYVYFNNNRNLFNKSYNLLVRTNLTEEGIHISTNPVYNLMNLNIRYIVILILLIMFMLSSGYFIITNVFNLAIYLDLKQYSLLGLLGADKEQLNKIVIANSIFVSLIAIPIGIVCSALINNSIIKNVGSLVTFKISGFYNIWLYFIIALFTFIVIIFSSLKVNRKINKLSYIDSLNLGEVKNLKKSYKRKSNENLSIIAIARIQAVSDKKRLLVFITTLSITPIIISFLLTFIISMNEEKYMERFVNSDFLVANSNYLKIPYDEKSFLTNTQVDSVRDKYLKYIIGENKVYFTPSSRIEFINNEVVELKDDLFNIKIKNEIKPAEVYATNEYGLLKYEVVDEIVNKTQFKEIIEILNVDDFGKEIINSGTLGLGSELELIFNDNKVYKCVVTKQIKSNEMMENRRGSLNDIPTVMLKDEDYKNIVGKDEPMLYMFDTKEEDIFIVDESLAINLKSNEHMDYESKVIHKENFSKLKKSFSIPGIALAIVISVIAIVNFITTLIIEFITREQEFDMLLKIGIEKNQLIKLLLSEVLMYNFIICIFSCFLVIVLNGVLLRILINNIWFMTYKFNFVFILIIAFYLIFTTFIMWLYYFLRLKKWRVKV